LTHRRSRIGRLVAAEVVEDGAGHVIFITQFVVWASRDLVLGGDGDAGYDGQ
jgi:hypothetical protein